VEANIRETIIGLFRQKRQMKNLGEDEVFFDRGVSSLSIIELQIGIEEALGITVPTSDLMRLGTMKGWIDAYSSRARQRDTVSAASA
jgi:acyl carrier protein